MKSCLVVDDSRIVRKVVRRIVEDLGFACQEAEDGLRAYETCMEGGVPDLTVLDWNMPVMSGVEFLEKLRQLENGDHARILFCTTEDGRQQIERGLMAGANEYVMKPLDRDVISAKLSQIGMLDHIPH